MTRQRQLILEIIDAARNHPTAQEIFQKARGRMPAIALGTVYRNLGILADGGEIRRIVLPGQPERYDRAGEPHDHMVCAVCGELFDLNLKDFRPQLEREMGVSVLSYELQVQCICPNCAKKDSAVKKRTQPLFTDIKTKQ